MPDSDNIITINLLLQKWTAEGWTVVPVMLSAPGNALYRDVVDAVATNREGGYPFIDYMDEEHDEHFALPIDRTATMAQVAEALGEDVQADPPNLHLGAGGRGGDGGFSINALIEQANNLKQVGEWVGLGLGAWKLLVAKNYRYTRRLAKDWIDTGEISMELRQAVLATNRWERKDFDRVFKLRDRGPELLRSVGYERNMQYGEVWREIGGSL